MIQSEYDSEDFTKALDNYENSEFIDCTFDSLDLQETSFKYSRFIDCTFKNCNLSNANFLSASIRDTQFTNCKLIGINWSITDNLNSPIFLNCVLNMCSFQDLKLIALDAQNCLFHESDFSNAELTKSIFKGSDFKEALFHGADLEQANFEDAKNYFIDPAITKIKGAKFSTPDVYSFFKTLDIIVDDVKP